MCISIFVNYLLIYSHIFFGCHTGKYVYMIFHSHCHHDNTTWLCNWVRATARVFINVFSYQSSAVCLNWRAEVWLYSMTWLRSTRLWTCLTQRDNWLTSAYKCSFHLYKKVSISKLCFLSITSLQLNKLDPECQKHFHRGFFQDSNKAKRITMDAHKKKKNKFWVLLRIPTC